MDQLFLADILMSIGGAIGFVTKAYAVYDTDTTWPRRSSGTNVITYPITGIVPYYWIGLKFMLVVGFMKYLLRVAIYIWRAPENEDWLGRKDKEEIKWLKSWKSRLLPPLQALYDLLLPLRERLRRS